MVQTNMTSYDQLMIRRLSLMAVRAALRDIDDRDPMNRLSAMVWFENRDEGLASFNSACESLVAQAKHLPQEQQAKLEESPLLSGNSPLSAEGWRSAVEATLALDADARGAFCGLLDNMMQGLPPTPSRPVLRQARPSHSYSGRGGPGM